MGEIEKLLRKRKRNGQAKYRKKGRERKELQDGGHVEEIISKVVQHAIQDLIILT